MGVAEKTAFAKEILRNCEIKQHNPLKVVLRTLDGANERATIQRINDQVDKCNWFNIVSVVCGKRGCIKITFQNKRDTREFVKLGNIDEKDLRKLIQAEQDVLVG